MILKLTVFFISISLFAVLGYITCSIWFKSKRTTELRLFFTLGLILSFWTLFNGISILLTQEIYEMVYPFYFSLACFLPTVFLGYSLYLSKSKLTSKKWLLPILAIFPISDYILLITNPWHHNLIAGYDGLRPIDGELFPLHLVLGYTPMLCGTVILAIYIFKNVKKIPPLAYIGFGILLTITFNVIYTFDIIDFGFDITPFTFIVIFIGFIVYSSKLRQFEASESAELAATKAEYSATLELQLAKMNLINKAARIGLWELFVKSDDTMNIKNTIIYSNEFREILGYDDENDFPNVLESFHNCLHADDYQMVTDKLNACIFDTTGKTIFDTEYQAKKKNGEYIYVHATGVSLRDKKGNAVRSLGTIMDITEEKNTLATTENLRKQAEDANQSKSEFLANMSHEIRTPLNAVIGLSDLIIDTDSSLCEESRYRLDQINSAGATLLNTVNDILDISKIEVGKFELIIAMYDIPSMINDAVTQSIMHREDKPIEFLMNICDNLPTHLYGDELRIKQVLNNFLSNAFKYTLSGSVELSIDFTREDESVWLTFTIRDTGIGIRQEDMDNLFNDYVQLDTSSHRNVIGTGLGLSIAKRLVNLMNGEIKVESEYGKGSTFIVKIEQKHATDQVIDSDAIESLKNLNYYEQKRRQYGYISRISLPYARVLLVDDVATNLDVTKGLMKPYKIHIDCVKSGQESIEAMLDSRVRYNAIFMDHMMPGMDGMEALKRIRDIGTDYANNIPIIALTANAIVGNEEMFLKNGFQAFISKPIEIAHLDAIIREWVRDEEQEKLYKQTANKKLHFLEDDMNWKALYKGVSGINIDKGLLHFYSDKKSYLSVLRSYAKNTPPLLDAAEAFTNDNLSHYTTIVHGIKGSSAGIHAEKVVTLAEALEKAARTGDCDYIEANNPILIETVRKLISDIEVMLDELDSDNRKPLKEKPDSKMLSKLYLACKDYEMDDVDAALYALEAYDYEDSESSDLIVWLRENVEQMNFEDIVTKISEIHDDLLQEILPDSISRADENQKNRTLGNRFEAL